jgi:hypothetical protein
MILNEKLNGSLKPDNDMNTNEMSDRKMKILSALAVLVIGCLCWNASSASFAQSAPANQSPQLQEVVKLTQAKMGDDVILQYIKNSGATYSMSADDILYLNSQGVSQPVISALLASKGSAPAMSAPVAVPQPATPAPQVSPYPGQVSPYPGQPLVSTPVAIPPPGSDISLSYFQAQLSPYGSWVDVPGEGACWVPSVQMSVPDWRPYLNDGHWIYTDDGWSWQSDYPWGEYAFHYGRWFRDARYGWVWRPGYHWGPAWVSWRHAEAAGYCGWAPLPPAAVFEPGVGIMWDGRLAADVDFGLAPEMYVFIPFDHFWVHDYVAFRAPFGRVPFLFHASILANHFGIVGGRFMFGGIGRDRMAVLTHHEVRVDRLEIRDSHIARAREVEHAHVSELHAVGHDEHGIIHDEHAVGHDEHSAGHDEHGSGIFKDHDNH